MIPKISRGTNTGGLVRYLGGPGKSDEHTAQRVIGGSPGITTGDLTDPAVRIQVTADLEAPALAHPDVTVKAGPVWHCSLSLAQREGTLSDDKWRAIADDFVHEMKFDGPTRWIVARHGLSAAGNDHVHLVVQLVREDGRQVNTNRDWPRAQAACNRLEHKHGLEVIPSRERGAGRKAMTGRDIREAGHAEDQAAGRTPAEASRARNERAGAQRDQLELRVRAAAKAALTEGDFVRGLRADGVQVRPWVTRGRVAGYAVRTDGGPWLAGSKLGRDLTLPRLRAGWVTDRDHELVIWGRDPGRARTAAPVGLAVHKQVHAELRSLARRAGSMSRPELAGAAHDVAGALSAAATRRPELARQARELGAVGGVRGPATVRPRHARSAALLVVQAMDDRDEVRQGVLLSQLLATAKAIQDAERAQRAAARAGRGAGMAEYDGLDEPMEGLATVGITVAARAMEGHARAKEQEARERQQTAHDEQRAEQRRGDEDQAVTVDAPSEFAWRDADKPMTPRQREVLAERGYRAEDLAGMPRRVASRHIGGELGPEDAHQSRGQRPAEPSATAGHSQGQDPAKPALAEQQERQRREQPRRGRGGRRRST